jgi:hypothetical protein
MGTEGKKKRGGSLASGARLVPTWKGGSEGEEAGRSLRWRCCWLLLYAAARCCSRKEEAQEQPKVRPPSFLFISVFLSNRFKERKERGARKRIW